MTSLLRSVFSAALWTTPAVAQMPFLFTTSQTEQTLSGSAGTVLKTLRPNEVAMVEFWSCTGLSAEKWSPRTCYNTMAGDTDGDTTKWDPTLFGSIDALCEILGPIGLSNQRTVFWSPSVAMQPGVSGTPAIRPGDTARIVRNANGDGQVEYFLRLEQVLSALAMPMNSVVDVDAIAADPSYGVFFSLDADTAVNCGCTNFVRDGDVLMIPPTAITWTSDFRVQSVTPGSALVLYTEAQMDAFVGNAVVSNHLWQCLGSIDDVEALDLDWQAPIQAMQLCSYSGILQIPALAFTGESMTGCSVLTTAAGGSILQRGCATLGTSCNFGATTGAQMGLQPPTSSGVPSFVNALTTAFPRQFTLEPHQHQFLVGGSAVLDLYSPGIFTAVFARFDSMAPNSVAPSLGYSNMHFPDEYITGNVIALLVPGGYQTLNVGVIPLPVKIVWQAAAISPWNTIELSTPATMDIY